MEDIIDILKHMVSTGQPPQEGCSKLGVGYEAEFEKLRSEYLYDQLQKGMSSEKFVVGPYGAGKTHFLRQFSEMARASRCATAEIQLSKAIDITKQLIVYKELVACLKVPGQELFGMKPLLRRCIDAVKEKLPDPNTTDAFVDSWIKGLEESDFSEKRYQRVLIKTLRAFIDDHAAIIDAGVRWLEGDVNTKEVCKVLQESTITKNEQDLFGHKAIFSVCQFIKYSGFTGSVIAYDEAEQAVDVGRRRREQILSMLRTESDARRNASKKNASAFFMYAFTPKIIQDMNNYPALQQRIAEPDPQRKFFDCNVHSPLIDLQQSYQEKDASFSFLKRIGERLVNLFYEAHGNKIQKSLEELLVACDEWAEEIDVRDQSIEKRRDMVKLTCSRLLDLYERSMGIESSSRSTIETTDEDEV